MSEIAGLASINLAYTEQAATDGKTVQHSLLVAEDTPQSSGRVAIISGTVGTAGVTIALAPTTYLNANGDYVYFYSYEPLPRIAFKASGSQQTFLDDIDTSNTLRLCTTFDRVAMTQWPSGCNTEGGVFVYTSTGTADYTILLWAD